MWNDWTTLFALLGVWVEYFSLCSILKEALSCYPWNVMLSDNQSNVWIEIQLKGAIAPPCSLSSLLSELPLAHNIFDMWGLIRIHSRCKATDSWWKHFEFGLLVDLMVSVFQRCNASGFGFLSFIAICCGIISFRCLFKSQNCHNISWGVQYQAATETWIRSLLWFGSCFPCSAFSTVVITLLS